MKPGDWASVYIGHGRRRHRRGVLYMDHAGHVHYFQWDYDLPPGMTYEERFGRSDR